MAKFLLMFMFFVGCQCQHDSRSHDHAKLCKLCKLCKLFVLELMFVSHIGFYFYTTRQANRCVRYGSVYDHNVSLLTLSWRFSAVLQTLYQTDLRTDIRTDRWTDRWSGRRDPNRDARTHLKICMILFYYF